MSATYGKVNPGVHVDFVSKSILTGDQQAGIIWTLTAVSSLITVFRLAVRAKKFGKWSLDDFLALVAMSLILAMVIVYHYGYEDLHIVTDVSLLVRPPPPNYTEIVINTKKLSAIGSYLFYTALWTIKFSILAFFRRLGNKVRFTAIIWWIVTGFTALTYIGTAVSYDQYCGHFSYTSCVDQKSLNNGVVNLRYGVAVDVTTDALITMIPILILWNVQIPLKRKLTLLSILCTDIFVIVASLVRLKVVSDKGTTAAGDWLGLWNGIEVTFALALCNMVAFRSLFVTSTDSASPVSTRRRYLGNLFSFTRLTSRAGSNNNGSNGNGSSGNGGTRKNFFSHRTTEPSTGPDLSNSDSEKGLGGYSESSTFVGKDDANKVTTVIEAQPSSSGLSSPKPSHWTGRSILVSQGMTVDEPEPNYNDRWDSVRQASAAISPPAPAKGMK